MKILLDPILTSNPLSCSTNIQFLTFVDRLLVKQGRKDVFFYWLIPEYLTEEEIAEYPVHPNISYHKVPQHRDRTKEYLSLTDQFEKLVAFNGVLWDFDVILTVRSGLVPLTKLLITSPRQHGMTWLKEVWLIEEMPLMSFKSSVAHIDPIVQDRFTLAGYIAADRVMVLSYHEKGEALRIARETFVPSVVMDLQKKMKEVCPVQFQSYALKGDEGMYVRGASKPFCLSYVGRMDKTSSRLDEINDLMIKHWITKGDNVRLLVCTVSKTVKSFDEEQVEVLHASRDEFWELAKKDMHLMIMMHREAGFSLSLLEPMMLGVPCVIAKEAWSVALLGPDYPFYATGLQNAYGLVRAFYMDYAAMYAEFKAWHQNVFKPMFEQRFANDLLYNVLDDYVAAFENTVPARFKEKYHEKVNSFVIQMLTDATKDDTEFVLFDKVNQLAKEGKFDSLAARTQPDDRERKSLVFSTPWNEFRAVFQHLLGWEDASVQVGHLKRTATK